MTLSALTGFSDNFVGLIAELRGDLPVGSHYLGRRMNLFAVTGGVRGNLCGFWSLKATLFEMFAYLLAPGTRGVKICLIESLDLWCTTAACLDFITEIAEAVRQFRLIDSGRKLLRLKQTTLLQGTCLSVLTLGNIEDDGMSMELGRGIAVHGTGGVMFKLGGDEPASGFGWTVAAYAGLRVSLQLIQCDIHGLPMRVPYAAIATHESRKGYRLGR